MQKIIPAIKDYAKGISQLMLRDLENPNIKFSDKMISKFRKHAKKDSIIKEFDNPDFMCFLAVKDNVVKGFIAGYKENLSGAVVHYIAGDYIKTKELLLKVFIDKCRKEKKIWVMADSFEFMENDKLFKKKGFILVKKEKITENLELLWYKLNL